MAVRSQIASTKVVQVLRVYPAKVVARFERGIVYRIDPQTHTPPRITALFVTIGAALYKEFARVDVSPAIEKKYTVRTSPKSHTQ